MGNEATARHDNEDNSGDAFLISLLLEDIGIEVRTTIAKDGKMALDILNKEKEHQAVSLPLTW